MQLTGKQIVEQGIVYNVCEKGIQQQGVDVRLTRVHEVIRTCTGPFSGGGYVPVEGKTKTPQTIELATIDGVYDLPAGYYEIEFEEGCKIPANCAMVFKTRSSLVRCGAEVRSGQFDGGFETEKMGAFLKVEVPIQIEKGARVAQALVTETYTVDEENLYNGQWQNDNQRK